MGWRSALPNLGCCSPSAHLAGFGPDGWRGPLAHGRILGVLENPSYAGVYVFGRYQSKRTMTPGGEVCTQTQPVGMDAWRVCLKDHHEAYITWDGFVRNQEILAGNQSIISMRTPTARISRNVNASRTSWQGNRAI